MCEGNTVKKGGQGQDRTVDLPIFRRKRNSQLDLSGPTQFLSCRAESESALVYIELWKTCPFSDFHSLPRGHTCGDVALIDELHVQNSLVLIGDVGTCAFANSARESLELVGVRGTSTQVFSP